MAYDKRGDLTHRTVTFRGDPDQIGLVVHDGSGERVRVRFKGAEYPNSPHYQPGGPGEYVDRGALTDVTDVRDLAAEWGYTEEEDED
jgi:hypothetical protein